MDTCTRLSAAGVTPGRRLAWPIVIGRTRSRISRISRDRPLMALYSIQSGIVTDSAAFSFSIDFFCCSRYPANLISVSTARASFRRTAESVVGPLGICPESKQSAAEYSASKGSFATASRIAPRTGSIGLFHAVQVAPDKRNDLLRLGRPGI